MKTIRLDTPKPPAVALLPQDKRTRKPRCRSINEHDVQFIANHVARGLTETAAVNLLGKFKPQRWFDWKTKGKRTAKINDLLSRTTAHRMDNLMTSIETAAIPENAEKAKVRFDWRAAQMLAGLHDDRFRASPGQSANVTNNNTAIVLAVGGEDHLKKLVSVYAGQAGQVAEPEVKQLPPIEADVQAI